MEIKTIRAEIRSVENATVMMESGDHISVRYKDPRTGKFNVFNISAQHLVFLVEHEQTDTAILIHPGEVRVIGGVK